MTNIYKDNWPITLRNARKNAGFTQIGISKKLGIRRERWNQFEQGKAKPLADEFEKIYIELNCTKYDFFKINASFSEEEQELIDHMVTLIRLSNDSPSIQLTNFKFNISKTLRELLSKESLSLFR